VGGDYYDFYRREEDVLDLVIADVSGHSIGAALMAAEVRSVLHAKVHSFDSTGEILAALNEILYEDLSQAGLCITLAYLKLDVRTRTLTYSNAGHPPILLSRSSKMRCRQLDAEGLILGVKKGVLFEEKRVLLQSGDLLLLYTDGITEAQNEAGELFGCARLCTLLRSMHGCPPEEIVDAVHAKVAEFTRTCTMVDDITMIVMKVM
jgi:sigma-B regulation protein RsbU (phosphoserine phosphatase)